MIYTCRHCGREFDKLYLGLQCHIQEIHPTKYNHARDIQPYIDALANAEIPQLSPAEQRARRRLFWSITGATFVITAFATYAVVAMIDDNTPILAAVTALIWAAWVVLSVLIVKGLVE